MGSFLFALSSFMISIILLLNAVSNFGNAIAIESTEIALKGRFSFSGTTLFPETMQIPFDAYAFINPV